MPNISKSFNFRNGVQVDNDNFIVNPNGLVGIGTSIPREFLDVHGTAKITGLVTTTNLAVSGSSIFYDVVRVGSAISFYPSTGILSATAFYGDGSTLSNIVGFSTNSWILNIAQTGLSTSLNIGIGTQALDAYDLVIGDDPLVSEGISFVGSTGNVYSSGIVTATSFSGSGLSLTALNASNIASGILNTTRLPSNVNIGGIATAYSFSGFGTDITGINASNIGVGTLNTERLPQNISIAGSITANSGIITSLMSININNTGIATLGVATVSQLYVSGGISGNLTGNVYSIGISTFSGGIEGNVTGIASTARSLTGTPNIVVGIVSATTISVGRIGIGSNLPSEAIQIIGNEISTIEVVGTETRLILAQEKSNISIASSAGFIRYGNSNGTFELLNQAPGNFNLYLHSGNAGINTGRFGWVYGQNFKELMSLTYTGRLGLGIINPTSDLHIAGTATTALLVSGNSRFKNNVNIEGTLTLPSLSTNLTGNVTGNVNASSGISTFNHINAIRIGINTNSPTEDIDAKFSTALFSAVGVGTTTLGVAKLRVEGFSQFTSIGIGTTALYSVPDDGSSGILQVHNNGINIFNGSFLIDNSRTSSLGFGTFVPRSILDFGNVGAAASTGFMIMPTLNSDQRNDLAYEVAGAIIYNSSTNKHQGYNGTTWNDLY